jgi:anti-sigma regulatory factor (Ser/Thr protein kinase)
MLRMPRDIAFSLELDASEAAANQVRRAIDDRLSRVLSKELVVDLMTVVSELVNNAVRHGPGTTVKVTLKTSRDGHGVSGEVEDGGVGRIAMRDMDGMRGGFGLHIVDALVDRWGVYEGSTHVWFELSER